MKSKTNCFNCKITLNDNELHNKDYKSLKEISDDLGLSYAIIADLSNGRKQSKKYDKFKYQPKIEISRINKNNENI
jgi:hypothetical protein